MIFFDNAVLVFVESVPEVVWATIMLDHFIDHLHLPKNSSCGYVKIIGQCSPVKESIILQLSVAKDKPCDGTLLRQIKAEMVNVFFSTFKAFWNK